MGSNHPISLRVKKYNGWQGTLYKYQPKALLDLASLQKNLSEIIHHYFQYVLISKPKFYYTAEALKIKIIYYLHGDPAIHRLQSKEKHKGELKKQSVRPQKKNKAENYNRDALRGILTGLETKNTLILENILKERTGTKVNLQLIRLKSPILDSKILARFISISLRKFSISALWRILLKKIKFKGNHLKASQPIKVNHYFDWTHLLKDAFFSREFYSYVNGLKLKISGRPSKRRGASRTKVKNYSLGSFKFNSINSLIDYGHIERKDKNGSQSIKVYTSTAIMCKRQKAQRVP